jgi:Caspase domain
MTRRPGNIIAAITAILMLAGGPACAENRIALVIGNSNYRSVPPLVTPATDAKAFADLLTAANFEVVWGADIGQIDMRRAIRDFSAAVAAKGPDTIVLIFYAGYGIQVDGENFLIPVDARIERESDVAVEAVRLADVTNALSAPPSKARIFIVDASHGNPFTQFNKFSARGMAIIDAPEASIVAYSATPGTEGANRPFTATLIDAAKIPNLPIEDIFRLVRVATYEASNGQQLPWEVSKLTIGFSLFPGPNPTGAPDLSVKPAEYWRKEIPSRPQAEAFRFILSQDATEGYEELLRIYPQAQFAPLVRSLLERRKEMVAWQNAYKLNSVASYEGFLARYPGSDLSPTAQRILDRVRANFTTANSPPVAVVTPPPATAGSPNRSAKSKQRASDDDEEQPRRKQKAKSKQSASDDDDDDGQPRRKSKKDEVPRRARTAVKEEFRQSTPPQNQIIPLGIGGRGIGGFGIGLGRIR